MREPLMLLDRTGQRSPEQAPGVAMSGSPVMIFEMDGAGIAQESAPARRVNVRLLGCIRDTEPDQESPDTDLSAVLVLRGLTPSRLLACVRAVTRGGASIPPELLCRMLPPEPPAPRQPDDRTLNDRELTVLRLLADGEVTRSIAEQLNYSERTVKSIVAGVLEKLECRTRAHAVGLATRQGMI
jgi:DNA-binding CsgD family transcriptional regulator